MGNYTNNDKIIGLTVENISGMFRCNFALALAMLPSVATAWK